TPIALLMYGWFVQYQLSIWLVLFAPLLAGCGMLFVMTGSSMLLVDSFPGKSASAISASNLIRSIFTTIGTAIAVPLLDALGSGPTFSLLAGITTLTGIGTCCIFFYGQHWHQKWVSKHQ